MYELFACWVSFLTFLASADIFQNQLLKKFFQEYHQPMGVLNSLDANQAQHFVGPDLGLSCMQL